MTRGRLERRMGEGWKYFNGEYAFLQSLLSHWFQRRVRRLTETATIADLLLA